ncbi:SCP2 sterol-binding domain-containing protein [Amycolatopsis minnesotensis]|uniref:SCP2 domain-containing protein n=1 Tax=Amycolatopsis minnesotensis TaxID=337894 RepID=A0ABN2RRR4_9PSEU
MTGELAKLDEFFLRLSSEPSAVAATVDAAEIATAVAETDRDELRARLRGGIGKVLVDEVIRRLPEYVDQTAAAGVNRVVGWHLFGEDGVVDRFVLRFDNGVVSVGRDLDGAPSVTLRLGTADFLVLATGNGDPATMVLSGVLRIEGDAAVALDLVRLLRIPSAKGVVEVDDPRAVDVTRIAALIGKIEPRKLAERLRGPVGRIVVDEVIRRLPEYVDPVAAAGVNQVIGWRLLDERGAGDRFLLRIDDGVASAGRELDGVPSVTLRLGTADFLVLATGNGDPATMVLSGVLRIEGDAAVALDLVRLLRIPSAKGVVEVGDPRAVDVGSIVRLVASTSDRDLKERLRGPVRQILLDEIFRRLPGYLNPRRAAGVEGMIAWQITGGTGRYDEYRTRITGGTATVGDLPGKPSLTIRTDPVLFFKLVTGNLNPVKAFLWRRLSVRGDLAFASRLPAIFSIPKA